MGLAFVGFKSIRERPAQPDETSKRAEIANPIEHIRNNFEEVSEVEIDIFKAMHIDGASMYSVTYELFLLHFFSGSTADSKVRGSVFSASTFNFEF